MPSLSSIGDTASVRNRYSARTIFLVEGAADKNIYERIVGPGHEADIEFRIAPAGAGQGGCRAVRDRVPIERVTNKQVFGLVDGEVAASCDAVDSLLTCADPLFTVEGEDGFIFLGAHEIENLFFEHADVCGTIANNAPAARLHIVTAAAVSTTLDSAIQNFLNGAIFKYASAHFHALGQVRRILSTRIFGTGTCAQITMQVRAAITSGGTTSWSDFLLKVCQLWIKAQALEAAIQDVGERRSWRLRVADGKELLSHLRTSHGGVPETIEGHLLKQLCEGEYPERFRTALFGIAKVRQTTFAA